jgi:hypothetical protein
MVVAVIAVGVMQVAGDEVIDMVAVRHGLVAATGSMPVALVMLVAVMLGRAGGRVTAAHLELVLLDPCLPRMMQMAIMQVIDVAFVANAGMATVRAVLVRVFFVVLGHRQILL